MKPLGSGFPKENKPLLLPPTKPTRPAPKSKQHTQTNAKLDGMQPALQCRMITWHGTHVYKSYEAIIIKRGRYVALYPPTCS